MSESLWNSPITRRYVNSLVFEYDKTVSTFGKKIPMIAILPTFLESETSLIERDTNEKIDEFWKNLQSMNIVKMHSYLEHLEILGVDLNDGIETRYCEKPYERIDFEKEVKVEILNINALQDLYVDFEKNADPDLSLISGLSELSRGHTIWLNSQNVFEYNNKYSLRLEFGSQAYLVLASVLRHRLQGDRVVTYQQIADDVLFPLTEKQKDYSPAKQMAERNRKISNCVTKISSEFDRVMERYAEDGPLEVVDMVSITILPKAGVKMINPVLF